MQEVTLDGEKLHNLALANQTAGALASALSQRERAHKFSDIRRYKQLLLAAGEKVNEGDYIKFWKDLQAAGVGQIIYGRRGRPNRFAWKYDLKAVAHALVAGQNVKVNKAPVPRRLMAKAPAQSTTPAIDTLLNLNCIIVVLDGGRQAELNLPNQLTNTEVDKLTSILRHFALK